MATTIIQVRRDTSANWASNNPILATGELGFETDTGLFKIGRNDTDWTSLDYAQVAGPAGADGAPGPKGDTGEVGAMGYPGVDGANGVDGMDGVNGMDGMDGLSAYEIWINLGNSGTEQDFIDSLQGIDGAPGDPGNPGDPGIDGIDGVDGDPGYIQQLVFTYATSSPNTNFGNWTNPTTSATTSGSTGFPDIYNKSFNIEKTSATSVIEINFDAVFDVSFSQDLGWGPT